MYNFRVFFQELEGDFLVLSERVVSVHHKSQVIFEYRDTAQLFGFQSVLEHIELYRRQSEDAYVRHTAARLFNDPVGIGLQERNSKTGLAFVKVRYHLTHSSRNIR